MTRSWEEIEEILISSDVGVDTSLKIIDQMKQRVRSGELDSPEAVTGALKQALVEDLAADPEDLPAGADETDGPYVILMVGVNGVGKTTSIGKAGPPLQPVGAAGDAGRGRHLSGRGSRAVGGPWRTSRRRCDPPCAGG